MPKITKKNNKIQVPNVLMKDELDAELQNKSNRLKLEWASKDLYTIRDFLSLYKDLKFDGELISKSGDVLKRIVDVLECQESNLFREVTELENEIYGSLDVRPCGTKARK